ncbi:MAG: c-type cytochrome [Flavobacteriaceae bacterium]|jgi:hypothetical protein
MKTFLPYLFLISFILITACEQYKCQDHPHDRAQENVSLEKQIAMGKRLVTALGCNDCHSPKVFSATGVALNDSLLLSGHHGPLPLPSSPFQEIDARFWMVFATDGTASIGPWGVSYASNLTPHETGLKGWTIEQFTRAMQEGKYKGLPEGRTLLPPMPWPGYQALTDEELKAIFSYLQHLPAVANRVPAPMPPQMVN